MSKRRNLQSVSTSTSPTDLTSRSATQLAAAIAGKEASSREVLDAFLDRIARLDGPINAVVTIDAPRARAEAEAADVAVARGDALGPLHGVPMTVKDSLMTAGMRTTSGAPELSEFVPDVDAHAVAAMRRAGAVIFGKTNLPIYAGDFQTFNEVFGTTNNPYDLSRVPGGSSGGSAAALACRFTPIEIGSDIGGSIRLPAHMSGVAGLKPSYGVVPAHGQIPGPPGTLTLADLAVIGPMARTIDDLALGLGLMSGPNRWDAPAWRLDLPPARTTDPKQLRIATWLDDERCPVEPEVRTLLEGAATILLGMSAVVDDTARPSFSLTKAADTFEALLIAALAGGYSRDEVDRFATDDRDSTVGHAHRLTAMRHREWQSFNERRLQMRLRWEEFFGSGYDVILLPVMPCVAIPHDQSEPQSARVARIGGVDRPYSDCMTWMAPAGLAHLPATVVPVGRTAAGMPVGIQIVGPYLHDRMTLEVGRLLLDALGGCPSPDL